MIPNVTPQEMSAYRSRVVNTVGCPYCHALAGFPCRELDKGKVIVPTLAYIHDDRSLAFMISRESAAMKAEVKPDNKRLQFYIIYMNDTEGWIEIPPDQGWKLKNHSGVPILVIGTGIPRVTVPLANVKSFEIQEF